MTKKHDTQAEVNARKLVAARREGRERPILEQRFKETYGKWPSATELQQALPFLKLKPSKEKEA